MNRSPTRPEIAMVVAFLVIILVPGVIQTIGELRQGDSIQALEALQLKPTAQNLRAYERGLEDASLTAKWVRPWIQYGQFALFQHPGDKAVRGRDGWLFYRPSFRYVTERPPIADAPSASNGPVAAIVHFRDRLAERGIRLVVMPAPNKESIYPEMLSTRLAGAPVLVSAQTRQVLQDLRAAGVNVIDLFEVYRRAKAKVQDQRTPPLYLARDTHWSPSGVALAAQAAAQTLLTNGWLAPGEEPFATTPVTVRRVGDIARMLQAPQVERLIDLEDVVCQSVRRGTNRALPVEDPRAEILVLGDSFLRIYEQDAPTSAGFIAQLARELGRPVATIVSDGGASTLVRQELHGRPQWLAGKKVVLWEFVERDLRFGTEGWQHVPLPPAVVPPATSPAPR